MKGVVAIAGTVGTVPLSLWDFAENGYETGHVEGAITIVAEDEVLAGLVPHAGAAAAVELVEALVLGGLDGVSALVTDRGERDLGHDGVGLDHEAVDDDGGRGFHNAWRRRAGHLAGAREAQAMC